MSLFTQGVRLRAHVPNPTLFTRTCYVQAVRTPALWSRISLARAGLPASFHDFLQHRQA